MVFFSGYGHRHISGTLNFIFKKILDFLGKAILIYEQRHGTYYPVCGMVHIKYHKE